MIKAGETRGRYLKRLKDTYSIAFIPHNEKSVKSFNLSLFSLILIGLLLFAEGFVSSVLIYSSTRKNYEVLSLKENIKDSKSKIKKYEKEISEIYDHSNDFANSLKKINVKNSGAVTFSDKLKKVDYLLTASVPEINELSSFMNGNNATYRNVPHVWPLGNGAGEVTMYYGTNADPFTGVQYFHEGIDISAHRTGDPVIATADGVVITAGYKAGSYGNYVVIQHKYAMKTLYAHMESIKVSTGQKVSLGQVIGYVGTTGKVTGPHLHYQMWIAGTLVNPVDFLPISQH